MSIGTIVYQQRHTPASSRDVSHMAPATKPDSSTAVTDHSMVVRRLDLIADQLLFPRDLTPVAGDLFVEQFGERAAIAAHGGVRISLAVGGVSRLRNAEGLACGVGLFRDTKQVNPGSVENDLRRSDRVQGLRPWYRSDEIALAEGDSLFLGRSVLVVIRIFSMNPEGRIVGDERSGVLFRVRGLPGT